VQNLTPLALSSAEKSVTVQTHKITNKQIRPSSGGRPYIHTCRGQVLPIDASPLHWRRARRQKGTGVYRQYLPPRADSSDFGLLEERSSPKWEIPCPRRPWTIVQNLTPLALSPAEKSVTVQNGKFPKKQTNKQINSNRHIHTLPISMCGNDNQRLKLNKNSVGQHQLRILTQIDP